MLKIDKKDEEIVVIFSPVEEIVNALIFFTCFFLGINIFIYFKSNLENFGINLKYTLTLYSLLIFITLLLFDKITIYFQKKEIKLIKTFYGLKRKEITLKYDEIKSIENIYVGGKGSFYKLLIKDSSGQEYPIVATTLIKELDEIIKVYENDVKEMLEKIDIKEKLNESKKNATETFNLPLSIRYQEILKKIIEEEKFYITQIEEKIIINGNQEAIENLEIFKNMEWEEINFYVFYVNYLSKKENENKKVIVAYNGIDGKEITMLELKEDINEIRDSKSTFKN